MNKIFFLIILLLPIFILGSESQINERVEILNKINKTDLETLKNFKKIDYFNATNSNFFTKFRNNYLKASLYLPYVTKYEIDQVILNNIDDKYKKSIENFKTVSSIDFFKDVNGISINGKRRGNTILNGELILSLKYHFLPKLLDFLVNNTNLNNLNNIRNYKMIISTHVKSYQIKKIEKSLLNLVSKIKTVKKISKLTISKLNHLYLIEYDNNSSDIIYLWSYGVILAHNSTRYKNSQQRWTTGIKKIVNIDKKLKIVKNGNNFIDFIAKNIYLGKRRRDIEVKIKKSNQNDMVDIKITENSFTNKEKRRFNQILKNWKQSRQTFAFALNINKKLTPKFKSFLYKLLVNSTMNKYKHNYNIHSKI